MLQLIKYIYIYISFYNPKLPFKIYFSFYKAPISYLFCIVLRYLKNELYFVLVETLNGSKVWKQ